ncbi:MAG: hypothetical protein MK240_10750 [Opitutales bacterium]|nr:hypothetical protein [Opitutales bacterium]
MKTDISISPSRAKFLNIVANWAGTSSNVIELFGDQVLAFTALKRKRCPGLLGFYLFWLQDPDLSIPATIEQAAIGSVD